MGKGAGYRSESLSVPMLAQIAPLGTGHAWFLVWG